MATSQVARVFVPTQQGIHDLPLSRLVRMVEKSGTEVADDAEDMVFTLREQVLGQDRALDAIQAALRVQPAHAGPNPRAYFVLEGPPATGKSLIMRELMADADVSDAVHGASLHEPLGPAPVIGLPGPYGGSGAPSLLTQFDNAWGVLGIDEMEKAHPEALFDAARATATGIDAHEYQSRLGQTLVVGTTSRGSGRHMALLLADATKQPVTLIPMQRLSPATGQRIFHRNLESAIAKFDDGGNGTSLTIDPAQLAAAEALIGQKVGRGGARIAQSEVRRLVQDAFQAQVLSA